MRGMKTVDLGLTVDKVTVRDGGIVDVSTVTLRAPALGKLDVHSTMKTFVEDGLAGFQVKQAQLARAAGIDLQAEQQKFLEAQRAAQDERPETETEDDDEEDPAENMAIMASGLGRTEYPEFVRYVKKVLTDCPKLADIGSDENGKPYAISDDFWNRLDQIDGGMDAAMRIMGAFADFFIASPTSRKKSGKKKSTTSAKRTKASAQ